jgi:hypothetical protein
MIHWQVTSNHDAWRIGWLLVLLRGDFSFQKWIGAAPYGGQIQTSQG